MWHEILRRSPHLVWLGLFTHRAFSSAQDDDTRGRKGSHLGDMLHVLGLAVLYYDTSRLLETEVPQRDFRVWLHPKRRLACPLRRLPMKPNGPRRRCRIDVPRRGTLLRNDQYANCAKRYSVSSFRAKREIFVIRGPAVNDWKFQTGNLLSTYLRASPHIYCSEAATTTLNPLPFLKTLHEKTLDTAASN